MLMMIRSLGRALVLSGLLGLVGSQAGAFTVSFSCIENDGFLAAQCAIGEDQFSAEISDLGGGEIEILFANSGPIPSIIADVYIDDGAGVFAEITAIEPRTGTTNFEEGASPPDLPGGNEVSPTFSADFSADAAPPTGTNGSGADPGDSFALILSLNDGFDFADVQAAFDAGTVRLGIHGQGLGEGQEGLGGSQGFVSGPPGEGPAVPEPTAALVFGVGLVAVAHRARRR
jgi:hypothetical protein